jgi:hypothetical protein
MLERNMAKGRAMTQAVSRRPLTAETRVNPCGICGRQSGTGKVFSPITSVSPCQFHSTGASLHGKLKKTVKSLSQGCTISLKAAGPFTKKNMTKLHY